MYQSRTARRLEVTGAPCTCRAWCVLHVPRYSWELVSEVCFLGFNSVQKKRCRHVCILSQFHSISRTTGHSVLSFLKMTFSGVPSFSGCHYRVNLFPESTYNISQCNLFWQSMCDHSICWLKYILKCAQIYFEALFSTSCEHLICLILVGRTTSSSLSRQAQNSCQEGRVKQIPLSSNRDPGSRNWAGLKESLKLYMLSLQWACTFSSAPFRG